MRDHQVVEVCPQRALEVVREEGNDSCFAGWQRANPVAEYLHEGVASKFDERASWVGQLECRGASAIEVIDARAKEFKVSTDLWLDQNQFSGIVCVLQPPPVEGQLLVNDCISENSAQEPPVERTVR